MSTKQIPTIILSLLTLFACVVTAVATVSVVNAKVGNDGWCEQNSDISDGTDDDCLRRTFDKLSPEQKSKVGNFTGFRQKAQACMSTGDYWNMGGNDGGSCANATVYCYTRAMEPDNCKNDVLGQIARGCNQGKDTDEHGCDPIKDINKPIVENIENQYKDKVEKSCHQKPGESEGDAITRCDKAYEEAKEYCSDQSRQPGFEPVDGDGEYLLADQDAYNNCLQDETRNRAQTDEECEERQGLWIDNKCRTYSDFTNKEDCVNKAHGEFKITKGADTPDPKDDVWTCTKPGEDGNGDDSDTVKDHSQASGSVGDDVPNSCGQAKTNLVDCNSGVCSNVSGGNGGEVTGGVPVFECVLKFGISALTVLVGVGAVAGIAWESLQYARAQDDQGTVANARNRIRDIVIGLIVYVFMVAIINWLLPGGVISP